MIECKECGFRASDKVIDNFSITICPNCNLPLFNLEEEKEKALSMAKSLGLDITAVNPSRQNEDAPGESATAVHGAHQTHRENSSREQSGFQGGIVGLTRSQFDEYIEDLGENGKT